MFARHTITALLALTAPLVARADVTPTGPAPGDVFKVTDTCRVTWLGDKDSTTVWKNMAIELMSGDNLDMVHITTVATAQDGTVDGVFQYPCPNVTPNSAIYFYQFSSAQTAVKTWTTRFTLASASGATTPPANATQPGSNDPIPWGVGSLVDPSQAVAAPASGGGTSNATSLPVTGSSTPAPVLLPSSAVSATASSASHSLTTVISSSSSSGSAATTSQTAKSGASAFGVDARVGLGAVALLALFLL